MSQTKRLRPGRAAGRRAAGSVSSSLRSVMIDGAPGVTERECDRLRHVLAQPIVDDRAIRRVLADIEMFAAPGAVGQLMVAMPPPMPEAIAKAKAPSHAGQRAEMQLCADGRRAAGIRRDAALPSASARSGEMSSRIQNERPCVPATRSSPLILRS